MLTKLLETLLGVSPIDGTCDEELVDYHERFGFLLCKRMMIRNYEKAAR